MTLSPSGEIEANVARRDERRRYVRRNVWHYAPAYLLFLKTVQWLLRPDPLSAASIKKALILKFLNGVLGVPFCAYLLGRRWDRTYGGIRGK